MKETLVESALAYAAVAKWPSYIKSIITLIAASYNCGGLV